MTTLTSFLWFDTEAEEAANFYVSLLPDSSIGRITHSPTDMSGRPAGSVLTVEFTVLGIPCIGLNGGPQVRHSEAFSFQVGTDSQEETDRYWNAIVDNGGEEIMCGWCKDRWGVYWQITPKVLTDALSNPDRDVAKRVFEAMMKMKKIDIAELERAAEAARRG